MAPGHRLRARPGRLAAGRRLHGVLIGIRGRYPSWSRRRVRYAVSAVLPASSMALS